MSWVSIIAVSAVLLVISESAKLLSYITPCKQNDPKLDECMKNSFLPFPNLVHGSKKYGIPDFDPLPIDKVIIRQGTDQIGLNIEMNNCKFFGLGNNKILKARTDLKKQKIEWDVINEGGYKIVGKYKASGKFLLLPITGERDVIIDILNIKTTIKLNYDLVNNKGKKTMKITEIKLANEFGQVIFKFDNLFNGDKTLGDSMNNFLNENWREMTSILEGGFARAVEDYFKMAFNERVFTQVTYDEMFPM